MKLADLSTEALFTKLHALPDPDYTEQWAAIIDTLRRRAEVTNDHELRVRVLCEHLPKAYPEVRITAADHL